MARVHSYFKKGLHDHHLVHLRSRYRPQHLWTGIEQRPEEWDGCESSGDHLENIFQPCPSSRHAKTGLSVCMYLFPELENGLHRQSADDIAPQTSAGDKVFAVCRDDRHHSAIERRMLILLGGAVDVRGEGRDESRDLPAAVISSTTEPGVLGGRSARHGVRRRSTIE